jgi:hypothetical protein
MPQPYGSTNPYGSSDKGPSAARRNAFFPCAHHYSQGTSPSLLSPCPKSISVPFADSKSVSECEKRYSVTAWKSLVGTLSPPTEAKRRAQMLAIISLYCDNRVLFLGTACNEAIPMARCKGARLGGATGGCSAGAVSGAQHREQRNMSVSAPNAKYLASEPMMFIRAEYCTFTGVPVFGHFWGARPGRTPAIAIWRLFLRTATLAIGAPQPRIPITPAPSTGVYFAAPKPALSYIAIRASAC